VRGDLFLFLAKLVGHKWVGRKIRRDRAHSEDGYCEGGGCSRPRRLGFLPYGEGHGQDRGGIVSLQGGGIGEVVLLSRRNPLAVVVPLEEEAVFGVLRVELSVRRASYSKKEFRDAEVFLVAALAGAGSRKKLEGLVRNGVLDESGTSFV